MDELPVACLIIQGSTETPEYPALAVLLIISPNPRSTEAMTFALLPRPVVLRTGLNVDALGAFLGQLDEESADCLAAELAIDICDLVDQYQWMRQCPFILAYLDDLSQTCQGHIRVTQTCEDHRSVIQELRKGLVERIRLRAWFLYVDTMLYRWHMTVTDDGA